jgi:hypothetical protein
LFEICTILGGAFSENEFGNESACGVCVVGDYCDVSLCVTYLQPDVMKLLTTINLSNTIRMNKVSGGVNGVNVNFAAAEGCITPTISDNHNTVLHEDTPERAILND